ncbi:hypothetical protein [Rhodovibrio sodomensis]|nr:hypothetical protein [Rhodovibrio sodomensis]
MTRPSKRTRPTREPVSLAVIEARRGEGWKDRAPALGIHRIVRGKKSEV